jgi:NADP-dependent 3-hydroxy acid dehydrogenase YdfG
MALRTIRDRTVVITGATGGIGRETALEFARAGAHVVVAGRRADRLAELRGSSSRTRASRNGRSS